MQQKTVVLDNGYAIAYTHVASIGQWPACSAFMVEAKLAIGAVYTEGGLEGYQLFIVENTDTAVDEQLTGEMLEKVTEGRFPFVYIRLQPATWAILDLDHFMSNLGCARVD